MAIDREVVDSWDERRYDDEECHLDCYFLLLTTTKNSILITGIFNPWNSKTRINLRGWTVKKVVWNPTLSRTPGTGRERWKLHPPGSPEACEMRFGKPLMIPLTFHLLLFLLLLHHENALHYFSTGRPLLINWIWLLLPVTWSGVNGCERERNTRATMGANWAGIIAFITVIGPRKTRSITKSQVGGANSQVEFWKVVITWIGSEEDWEKNSV